MATMSSSDTGGGLVQKTKQTRQTNRGKARYACRTNSADGIVDRMHFANDDDDNDDILNPLYCPPSKILSFLRKQQQHRLFVSLFEVLYIHASSPGRPASIPHTFIHVQESSSQPSPSRFRLFSLTWEAQAEAEGGAKVEEAVKEAEESWAVLVSF